VPAGRLGLLPLHAAAPDDLALTYAPNGRALAAAQATAAAFAGQPLTLFAVDNPDGSLAASARETAAVAAHFDDPWVASGHRATRPTALAGMAACAVHHFSCHGYLNPAAPLESGLALYTADPAAQQEAMLTLRDVLAREGTHARLTFLSACETNIPNLDVMDEVVALPTGFLQAGSAGVAGTLWSVNDASTAHLAAKFYDLWLNEGLPPAVALHRAQRWLRDEHPHWAHPFYWAGFTYTGV
jgi:CHAT domain-containing protein